MHKTLLNLSLFQNRFDVQQINMAPLHLFRIHFERGVRGLWEQPARCRYQQVGRFVQSECWSQLKRLAVHLNKLLRFHIMRKELRHDDVIKIFQTQNRPKKGTHILRFDKLCQIVKGLICLLKGPWYIANLAKSTHNILIVKWTDTCPLSQAHRQF